MGRYALRPTVADNPPAKECASVQKRPKCPRYGTWLHLPLAVMALLAAPAAWGGERNHLYRIDVRPHGGFTRLALKLEHPPEYTVATLPGNRVRVVLKDTDGRAGKQLRSLSTPHVAGCAVKRRGADLLVTVAVKGNPHGVRSFVAADSPSLSLDVGPALVPRQGSPFAEGREGIRTGVDRLFTRFDPPLKSDIPFVPTDRRTLEKQLPPEEIEQVLAGEAALYRGKGLASGRLSAGH